MNTDEDKDMRKHIVSGLQETIKAHGPITKQLIGSATKRIVGKLKSNHKRNTNAQTSDKTP